MQFFSSSQGYTDITTRETIETLIQKSQYHQKLPGIDEAAAALHYAELALSRDDIKQDLKHLTLCLENLRKLKETVHSYRTQSETNKKNGQRNGLYHSYMWSEERYGLVQLDEMSDRLIIKATSMQQPLLGKQLKQPISQSYYQQTDAEQLEKDSTEKKNGVRK